MFIQVLHAPRTHPFLLAHQDRSLLIEDFGEIFQFGNRAINEINSRTHICLVRLRALPFDAIVRGRSFERSSCAGCHGTIHSPCYTPQCQHNHDVIINGIISALWEINPCSPPQCISLVTLSIMICQGGEWLAQ